MVVQVNAKTLPRFEFFHTNVTVVRKAGYVSFYMSLDLSFVLVFFLAHSTLPKWATLRVFISDNGLGDQVVQLYKKCARVKFRFSQNKNNLPKINKNQLIQSIY
jgi:hypothetical protein